MVKLVGQLFNRGGAAHSAGRIHRRQANCFGLEDNVVSQLHVQDVISVFSLSICARAIPCHRNIFDGANVAFGMQKAMG